MLIRVKFREKLKEGDDGCICQQNNNCRLKDWVKCEAKLCTSLWWHKSCVGFANLTDKEF